MGGPEPYQSEPLDPAAVIPEAVVLGTEAMHVQERMAGYLS